MNSHVITFLNNHVITPVHTSVNSFEKFCLMSPTGDGARRMAQFVISDAIRGGSFTIVNLSSEVVTEVVVPIGWKIEDQAIAVGFVEDDKGQLMFQPRALVDPWTSSYAHE